MTPHPENGAYWRPELKTVEWAFSVLVEDYLYEDVRSQISARCASSDATFEFPNLPDRFWLTVTEAAIEVALDELMNTAQAAHELPNDQRTPGESLD